MIQDIFPHIYHNEYRPTPPEGDSYLILCQQDQVLIAPQKDGSFSLPRWRDLGAPGEPMASQAIYLFSVDEDRFYLLPGLTADSLPDCHFEKLTYLRTAQPGHLAFAAITGCQLSQWYGHHQFCSHCGKPLLHSEKERMLYCPDCRIPEYPTISPAVIIAITHGDRLLLSKYEGRSYKRYALIAGYAEIGETIEETVHREVMEEVGLKVKNLRYYKSQPWSFSGTLLFGFFCDLDGDDTITLDHEELSMAEWFSREEIPDEGENISLTKEMMMAFKHSLV